MKQIYIPFRYLVDTDDIFFLKCRIIQYINLN